MKAIAFWMRPLKGEGRVEFHLSDANTGLHIRGSGFERHIQRVLQDVEWTINTSLPQPGDGPVKRAVGGASTIPGQLTFEAFLPRGGGWRL